MLFTAPDTVTLGSQTQHSWWELPGLQAQLNKNGVHRYMMSGFPTLVPMHTMCGCRHDPINDQLEVFSPGLGTNWPTYEHATMLRTSRTTCSVISRVQLAHAKHRMSAVQL